MVENYVVSLTYKLDDGISAGTKAATDALNKLATAAGAGQKAVEDLGKTVERTGPSYEVVNRKLDEQAKLTTALEGVQRRHTQGLAAVRAEYDAGGLSADQLANKEKRLGIIRDEETKKAQRGAAALASQFTELGNANDKLTSQSNKAAFAVRQVGIQSIDLFTQIASGGSILTAFIQQGSQVAQTAAVMGVSFGEIARGVGGQLLSAFRFILTPMGAMLTGFAALGAVSAVLISRHLELEKQERSLGLAIEGTGRSASTSVGQLQEYVKQLKITGTSSEDAMKIAEKMARTQGLGGTAQQLVVSQTSKLASATGMADVEAANLLMKAHTGDAAAIKSIAEALGTYNSQQDRAILLAKTSKELAAANNEVMAAASDRLASISNRQSDIATSYGQIANSFDDMLNRMVKSPALKRIMDILAQGIELLNRATGGGVQVPKYQGKTAAEYEAEIAKTNKELAALGPRPEPVIGSGPSAWSTGTESSRPLSGAIGARQEQGTMAPDRTAFLRAEYDRKKAELELSKFSLETAKKILDTTTEQSAVHEQTIKQKQDDAAALERQDASTRSAQGKAKALMGGTSQGRIAELEGSKADFQKELDLLNAKTVKTAEDTKAIKFWTDSMKAADAEIANVNKSLETSTKSHATHRTAVEKTADTLDVQIKSQKELNEALKLGGTAVDEVMAKREAELKAIRDGIKPGTDDYTAAVIKNTEKIKERNALINEGDYTKLLTATKEQTDAIIRQAEAYDGTAESITRAQNVEKARAALKPSGQDTNAKAVSEIATEYDRATSATNRFQQAQSSVSALTGTLTNAFDQVGNALVTAFTSGADKAVSFGSIMKGILSSVLAQLAQLALFNPIMNSLGLGANGGSGSPTLMSALTALSNGSASGTSTATGTGSSSGGLGNLFSLFSNANSASSALTGNSLSSLLGLTDKGSLLSSIAGIELISAGVPSIAGAGASTIAAATAPSGLMSANAIAGSLGTGQVASAPLTLSGALSSVALPLAGFSLGSMGGGYIASALGKEPSMNPMIGAAGGVAAGAAIGSIIPGVGTLLGAFIGGLVGGGGGGLIGPKARSPFTTEQLTVTADGRLGMGRTDSQITSNVEEIKQLQADIDKVNQVLTLGKINIANPRNPASGFMSEGGIIQIGTGKTPNPDTDLKKFASLSEGFKELRFKSDDALLQKKLDNKSFGTLEELGKYVDEFQQAEAAVAEFLKNTTKAFADLGKTSGSLITEIDSVSEAYQAQIQTAKDLATNGAATDEQIKELADTQVKLEEAKIESLNNIQKRANDNLIAVNDNLENRRISATYGAGRPSPDQIMEIAYRNFDTAATAQRLQMSDQLIQTYGDAIKTQESYGKQLAVLDRTIAAERYAITAEFNKKMQATDRSFMNVTYDLQSRLLTARAKITGTAQDAEKQQIYAWSVTAMNQRLDLAQSMRDAYGDAYESTQQFAYRMSDLEKTLNEERLAILSETSKAAKAEADAAKSQRESVAGTMAGTITSIAAYVRNLQTNENSPLSPQDQLALASKQFNEIAEKARSGSGDAYGQITSYADTLLDASKNINGSGVGYVNDFDRVLNVLSGLTNTTADALTNATFASETRTATQILADGLLEVKAAIDAVQLTLKQGSSSPARLTG